eukprot:CAMPEP_0170442950 /NCGR_PEP_ID=MMETSP0117_2-20130122/47712_1 /TAXON_ID=400756 /ORGANISM="Durinskia baltica, Strain CSIRO CS-38" /LENGTH=1362 /DNA_ID=CAMNT_0010703615 /DNA_START=33 /DNA_END=4119 /DNA_ORIENTATION=-
MISNSVQNALKLERALGITSSSNASFCSSPSGDLFYSAGCFVVKYNPEDNKQKGFYKGSKAVSSIAVSGDGKFLAVGERGQSPLITVWNVERFEIIATLSAHKHGIGCMEFSPDGKFLVTVGYKLDRQLILWEWKTNQKLSVQKLGNRVHAVAFHSSGEYFVTAGDRHLKWWTINEVLEGEAVSLEGKAASILEDMRNSVFMDVICGSGNCDNSVYCTTSTGVLCLFNAEKMVEKWVQLESASSFCLELFSPDGIPGLLIVGCANGTIRCFDPQSLQYIATLPLPAPLLGAMPRADVPDEDTPASHALPTHAMYAALLWSLQSGGGKSKLSAKASNRSLFVWDISDLYAISKYRSFQFHRACVWDVQFIEGSALYSDTGPSTQNPLPKGTFVTCSADNTLRFWNTDQRLQRTSKFRSAHSREMLHCIDLLADVEPSETDDHAQNTSIATTNAGVTAASHGGEGALNSSISMTHYFAQQSNSTADLDICEGVPDLELPDRPQSKYSPRTLAVHPDAHELACGDKMGTLMIFDIRGMRQISATPAHAAEILALSYSPALVQDGEGAWSLREGMDESAGQKEAVLLASAGRDRLIHVYNASEHYDPIQTLDHHTSSVTIAKFTSDGRRFLSCGGDRKMVFSSLNGPSITHMKSVTTPMGTINGLAVEASNKFAVSSGQDKRLNIWNVHTGKHMRAYRSEHVHSELYKSDIDPSGTYIATCAFDKTISVFDFFSGELVTQVSGHSELVTGVKFSPDGRHLISIGGDGCIFMWKVADSLVKAMQDRLMELMNNAQRRNMKAVAAVRKSQADGMHMHPRDAPPPLPAPTFGTPGDGPAPRGAAGIPPLPAGTPVAESMDSKGSSTGPGHKSRWAERVENEHGYELFGKKIDPTATPDRNKNKFTLELTSTMRANLVPNSSEGVASEESAASGIGMEASRRVAALEDDDQVMCSAMSGSDTEDEGDGSELFKPAASAETHASEEYASDFETPTGESAAEHEGGPDLDRTHDVIEGLEKSVEDMDNWLANMVRGEGNLDEAIAPVAVAAVAVEAVIESPEAKKIQNRLVVNKVTGEMSSRPVRGVGQSVDLLDRSLSSAFFHNLHKNEGKPIASPPPKASPAAGTSAASIVAPDSAAHVQERKQRDTAAAVAQMRERLKVMGILEGTKKPADTTSTSVNSTETSPPHPQQQQQQQHAEDGYDTASTASEPDTEPSDPLERSAMLAHEISEKASKYRKILRELEVAKRRAAESFQELSGLRHSLDKSMRESTVLRSRNHQRAPSTASIPEDDVLDVSMAQVDELMMQFQDSLMGRVTIVGARRRRWDIPAAVPVHNRKSSASAMGHSSSSSGLGFSRSTDSAQMDVDAPYD